MFSQSRYSHAMSTNVRQIERRLRSLEQRLEGAGGRTSASAAEAAERVANAVASRRDGAEALNRPMDRRVLVQSAMSPRFIIAKDSA